jgi:hypothetical protein
MKRLLAAPCGNRVGCSAFVRAGAAALLAGSVAAGPVAAGPPLPVTVMTHHYDNWRTGWNPQETVLTTTNVNSRSFGLLRTVPLDDQVDAQPLVIYSPEHDNLPIVIVATENNTIDYINPATGAVMLSRNLGAPVPQSALPGRCNNNGPDVGITSTPVIDGPSRTLYVIAYTLESGQPVYRIHALDLATLDDKVGSGIVVGASQALSGGGVYHFNAAVTRQRPALLDANGNIYAGFGSFCDFKAAHSRGWVLGWHTGTLRPLPANQLNDQLPIVPSGFFLTSIWMSGAGIATNSAGDLFFVTSNSDSQSYDPPYNIQESVVEMSGDLRRIVGLYTPTGNQIGQPTLDINDYDFGSGGVLVVPEQPSLPLPNLAAAAGKAGYFYLFNRDAFAGLSGPGKVVESFPLDGCWCAESYFVGPDGIGRIVSSLGATVYVYKLQAAGNSVELAYETNSAVLATGQDAGFFTTVSSNDTRAGSAVIWAVGRPVNKNPANVTLYAFAAATGKTLYSAAAGRWPRSNANANIVPVVANGQVYVASYKRLAIFGLGGAQPGEIPAAIAVASDEQAAPEGGHQITGYVKRLIGPVVILQARTGALVHVDAAPAREAGLSAEIIVGNALIARGKYGANGVFHAEAVLRAKASPDLWEADR